jgi:hypothetical protein
MSDKHLEIRNLVDRHPGLTPAIGESYCEAASVCLSRHHVPPSEMEVAWGEARTMRAIDWDIPTPRIRSALANAIDATEFGAYAVSLAAIELEKGLVAVARAETLTGADYYVGSAESGNDDLEDSFRLEVSGTDSGSSTTVRERLRAKISQAAKGQSDLPAIAAVVAFKARVVLLAEVER